MEQVLNFIINGFSAVVDNAHKLTFSAFGFSLSLWDFQIALFVISVIVPLFFTLKTPRAAGLFKSSSSERNDDKKGGG